MQTAVEQMRLKKRCAKWIDTCAKSIADAGLPTATILRYRSIFPSVTNAMAVSYTHLTLPTIYSV